jgi:hypothetical protein
LTESSYGEEGEAKDVGVKKLEGETEVLVEIQRREMSPSLAMGPNI